MECSPPLMALSLVAPLSVDTKAAEEVIEACFSEYGWRTEIIDILNLKKNKGPAVSKTDSIREHLKKWDSFALDQKNIDMDLNSYLALKEIHSKALKEKTVFIIINIHAENSVKNLREILGKSFFQIGITSSAESVEEGQANAEPSFRWKVQIEKTYPLSDLFIKIEDKSMDFDESIWKGEIERFIDLVLGMPNISPTENEHNMFMAFMASTSSADLSRQVGAILLNSDRDVIASGCNDVPKFGGGQYWPPSQAYSPIHPKNESHAIQLSDQRDYVRGIDANSKELTDLANNIIDKIRPFFNSDNSDPSIFDEKIEDLRETLRKNTDLKNITEFGRVVHAEMSAITSAARTGARTKGGYLFCTTFPCHNCAKHIVSAGIQKVYYIEPYPKSKALTLHSDSITGRENDAKTESNVYSKVHFKQFTGIGPRRFIDLFSTMGIGDSKEVKRKLDNGIAVRAARGSEVAPRFDFIDLKTLNRRIEERHLLSDNEAHDLDQPWYEKKFLNSFVKAVTDKVIYVQKVQEDPREGYADKDYVLFKSEFTNNNLVSNLTKGQYISIKVCPIDNSDEYGRYKVTSLEDINVAQSNSQNTGKHLTSTIKYLNTKEGYGYLSPVSGVCDSDIYFRSHDLDSNCSIEDLNLSEEVIFEMQDQGKSDKPKAKKVRAR